MPIPTLGPDEGWFSKVQAKCELAPFSPTMKTPIAQAPEPTPRWRASARPAAQGAPAFAAAMQGAQRDAGVQVRPGDNLTHMVKAQARAQGVSLDESSAYRLALQVAKANGLAEPDRIDPGQRVDLGVVDKHLALRAADPLDARASTQQWLRAKTTPESASAATASGASSTPGGAALSSGEVLTRTLQRAVDKGFVPAHEQGAVRTRIETLANKYGFSPDDFALLSLMESDGLNPQASNGSCHGVIQFCEGPNRGAASVGMAVQPRAILGLSVLRQLDLVDRYLADAGVQPGAGLDDLYLSILTQAARSETRAHAPRPIAGRQASALYVNGNPAGVITRQSLTQGLLSNAAARLGLPVAQLLAMREPPEPRELSASSAPAD